MTHIRILIAEDDPITLQVVSLHLKGLGYHVDAAVDGVSALAAIKASRYVKPYDVLLTDFQMPNMDGRQLIATVCNDTIDTPIIVMMSSEPRDAIEARYGPIGCDVFMAKPIRCDDFDNAVDQLLAAKGRVESKSGESP